MKENLSGTLAIDLGNTNTVVAFQDQEDTHSVLIEIPNITSSPGVIPTAIWFEEPSKILNSLLVTISYAFPIRHAVTPEPQENTTFVFSSILFLLKIFCNSSFFL